MTKQTCVCVRDVEFFPAVPSFISTSVILFQLIPPSL